jgi:hypothetical protein
MKPLIGGAIDMNNHEARLILQGYRPGGQDAADPLFAEVLEQVQRDPELQKWFAKEQAFDLRMQAKLQEAIPIPSGLKANLLAQRKVVQPVRWWQQPVWLTAAAAALVLLVAIAVIGLNQASRPQFAEFREVMLKNSRQETGHLTFMTHDMAKIQSWLKTQNISPDSTCLPRCAPRPFTAARSWIGTGTRWRSSASCPTAAATLICS